MVFGLHFRFHRRSFLIFGIIFAIEVLIALYVRDQWVRPLIGDMLIVVAIAYFVHVFVALPLWKIAIATLLFAYAVECLQFFNLIDWLGWRGSAWAHLTIGSTFDWKDLIAYTLGIGIVLLLGDGE
jgi:hypothetical protein